MSFEDNGMKSFAEFAAKVDGEKTQEASVAADITPLQAQDVFVTLTNDQEPEAEVDPDPKTVENEPGEDKTGGSADADEGKAEDGPETKAAQSSEADEGEGVEEDGKESGPDAGSRRMRERQERAQQLAKAFEARERLEQQLRSARQAPKDGPKEPKPSEYEFGAVDQDYLDARAAWIASATVRNGTVAQVEADIAAVDEHINEERKREFSSIVETGTTKFNDFEDKVLKGANNWPLQQDTFDLAVESEHGADILYHLATNPDEAKRIAGLTPAKRGVEFARLESRFSLPGKSDPPAAANAGTKVSGPKAKAPPSKARGAGTRKGNPAQMDFATFEAHVAASEAKR